MRQFPLIALSAAVACIVIRAADWPSERGNPQRDGWAKTEKAFTVENARNIELLYKYKADNQARGQYALTSPLVNGMLITYLGFKEMLVFGGSSDNVYSVDADLNRLIWKAHFAYQGDKPQAAPTSVCPGGLTAAVAMPGSSTAGGRGFGTAPGRGVPGRGAGSGNAGIFASGFGRSGVFVAVGGDGQLHALNTSTGGDKIPPVKFLPPNSKAGSLNINDGVIYAATADNCGGNPNALYALDMSGESDKLTSLSTNGKGMAGTAGTAIGADGTVYSQAPDGNGDTAGSYNGTVLAMTKDLKVTDYFTPGGKGRASATPVVFSWKGKELIVASGPDNRLYLLDTKSPGGPDHHTPLYQTGPIAGGEGFQGGFASWEDTETNTRWVYASLWGPVSASAKFGASNGSATHGSIAAFKVEEANGQPTLTQAWISRDMIAPAPAVTANGLVFALSTGDKPPARATLYVLDGATGKELYSSGNAVNTFTHGTGLAVANRRIYFTTHDNTVYAFGFLAEQPQLTGK